MIRLPSHLDNVPDSGEVVGMGLLSGTSCDGIDVGIVKFSWTGNNYKVIDAYFQNYDYSTYLTEMLHSVSSEKPVLISDLVSLGVSVSNSFADAAFNTLHQTDLKPDYIVTHGQTVFHAGSNGTLQLCNPASIALKCGLWTIGNLRDADVAAKGDGAPILPICDILLRQDSEPKMILNLGGVANVTILSGTGEYRAYDIGPANAITDELCRLNVGMRYDDGGKIAASGTINNIDVQKLLTIIEEVSGNGSLHKDDVGRKIIEIWETDVTSFSDRLACAVEATAIHIASVLSKEDASKVYLSGGGWHNKHLTNRLAHHLSKEMLSIGDLHSQIVTVDNREAIDFALLGHLWFRGIPAGLKRVTGAEFDTIAGALWPPVLES